MNRENINLTLAVIVIVGFMVFIFFSLSSGTIADEETLTPTPIQDKTNGDPAGFNPNYGDLTEEQIKIVDIAVGNLLNNSEGITPPMISVINFEEKEFSDASLGCPQEGMSYAQVITPGYQVILEAQGNEYDYRLTDEKNIILCEK